MADSEDLAPDLGEPEVRPPVDLLPAWWGPIANEPEQLQLVASDFDVFAVAELSSFVDDEEQLRSFANESTPRHRYLLCERLSASRWGWVYTALDLLAERPVVLKISAREIEPEARTITRLQHPNVVTVYDMFVEAGYPTMVLEWCAQGNLSVYAYAAEDWREVLARGLEAGRGLAYCNEQGLIHGDIKPDNIFVTRNVGKVADFGLARPETIDGPIGGTLGFMPPERACGVWASAGDVYSFAMTLEWVLKTYEGVPRAVGVLLTAATAEDPERRPGLLTLIGELERCAAQPDAAPIVGVPVKSVAADTPVVSGRARGWQWVQRGVVAASLLVAAGLAWAPEPSPIEQALALAEAEARDGDTESAADYLELARKRARKEGDQDAMRMIAEVAEQLGDLAFMRGDRKGAGYSWNVAYDVFLELGDEHSTERLVKLLAAVVEPTARR